MVRKHRLVRAPYSRRLMMQTLEDRTVPTAGQLDPTFGVGGKVLTDIGMSIESIESARSVALQPDGKIVAAGSTGEGGSGFGDFVLARYNPNGSLDTSFGGLTGL